MKHLIPHLWISTTLESQIADSHNCREWVSKVAFEEKVSNGTGSVWMYEWYLAVVTSKFRWVDIFSDFPVLKGGIAYDTLHCGTIWASKSAEQSSTYLLFSALVRGHNTQQSHAGHIQVIIEASCSFSTINLIEYLKIKSTSNHSKLWREELNTSHHEHTTHVMLRI